MRTPLHHKINNCDLSAGVTGEAIHAAVRKLLNDMRDGNRSGKEEAIRNTASKLPRVIPFPEVQAITGLSRASIFELTRRGHFPKPISLTPSGKRKGYLVSEIEAWFEARMQERS